MKGENDQMSSLSSAMVRNWPARKPQRTSKGMAAHSPCRSAGMPMSTPPSDPARRPPITPSRRVVSKLTSPAAKLLCEIRVQTPTMIGRPNQSTRYSFCRMVRSSRNSNDLNSLERTSVLETAAATPSLNSKLRRMSRGSIRFVFVHYQRNSAAPKVDKKTVARPGLSISFLLGHHESQGLPRQIAAKIVREQLVVPVPQLIGKTGRMRRNQHSGDD